jgi:hypothetical protein
MCTKILKKESSSGALAFVLLMFMMPLGFIGNTQSCGAMEAEDVGAGERTPLSRDFVVSINGNARDLEEGIVSLRSLCRSRKPIPEVTVSPDLLKKVIPGDTQNQMNDVIDFISLHHNHKFFDKLRLKHQEGAKVASVSIDNLEKLQKYLENKAWNAISKSPTLANYLKERRLQTEELINVIEKIIIERDSLRQENKFLVQCLDELEEKRLKSEEGVEVIGRSGSRNETNKDLYSQINILKYVVTPISFVLGVVLGGVGAGLIVHFVWR